jgi:hypothetical protein
VGEGGGPKSVKGGKRGISDMEKERQIISASSYASKVEKPEGKNYSEDQGVDGRMGS